MCGGGERVGGVSLKTQAWVGFRNPIASSHHLSNTSISNVPLAGLELSAVINRQ